VAVTACSGGGRAVSQGGGRPPAPPARRKHGFKSRMRYQLRSHLSTFNCGSYRRVRAAGRAVSQGGGDPPHPPARRKHGFESRMRYRSRQATCEKERRRSAGSIPRANRERSGTYDLPMHVEQGGCAAGKS